MSTLRPQSAHLGTKVSAYVDRSLDARTLRELDRHLVVCQVCRHAADQERRLLTSLRTGPMPGVPEGLRSMLLDLGAQLPLGTAAGQGAGPGASGRPASSVPVRVSRMPELRLPTVAPAAPALHRSPVRAAMIAGLAAGASAAAAWSLTVGGAGPPSPAPARSPVARVPTPTTVGVGQSAVSYLNAGFTTPTSSQTTPQRPVP